MTPIPSVTLLDQGGGAMPVGHGQPAHGSREPQFVGWVERSETHHPVVLYTMGVAALHPSYRALSRVSTSGKRSGRRGLTI